MRYQNPAPEFSLSKVVSLFFFLTLLTGMTAQSLPKEYHFSPDGHRLIAGDRPADELYDRHVLREVHIDFPQANYWTLLTSNYQSETEIPATLTIDGTAYDSVGVRFRGNTSYQMIGSSQKKSFAIVSDFIHPDQTIMGYKNLKFNNGHQDPTFMREVLYCRMAKKYTPIAKTNYVHLFLNNVDWGVYPNIQAVDKTYLADWFMSNDGARFRATVEGTGGGPGGGGGGGGGGWGDGTAGMNYLGADSTQYKKYYGLKSADIQNPWQKLIDACQVLSTATANNMAAVNAKLDVDKILWHLAVENIFADDDSYVMKGKMDYYVYYEPETDRTVTLEYDGNSAFLDNAATSSSWGPFKNVSNANYPLLNKLLNIPQWRQRYLAHYRTILQETFTTENARAQIDSIDAQIKNLVAADTKKLYPTSQYTSGVNALKTYVTSRRNYLLGNAEVAQAAPVIGAVLHTNAASEEYGPVSANEEAFVNAAVTSTNGISKVNLYYCPGVTGIFSTIEMSDDGLHRDQAAGDGIFGASIPGFSTGTLVRYYIEAVAGNAALSVSYAPAGAEHDVYVYEVKAETQGNGVVINEILASNATGATDETGAHADWVELYNNNDFEVSLEGYHLSDDSGQLDKWTFPAGTLIPANGYLIVWADNDENDGPLHTSWKLSIDGEEVVLSNAALAIVDQVTYGPQVTDVAYARIPNGTGNFVSQAPTFSANNELASAVAGVEPESSLTAYPNPFTDVLFLACGGEEASSYQVLDQAGRILKVGQLQGPVSTLDLEGLAQGAYLIRLTGSAKGVVRVIKL